MYCIVETLKHTLNRKSFKSDIEMTNLRVIIWYAKRQFEFENESRYSYYIFHFE